MKSKIKLPKQLVKELLEIEKDALELKNKNDLTEHGEGELHIISLIRKYIDLEDNDGKAE